MQSFLLGPSVHLTHSPEQHSLPDELVDAFGRKMLDRDKVRRRPPGICIGKSIPIGQPIATCLSLVSLLLIIICSTNKQTNLISPVEAAHNQQEGNNYTPLDADNKSDQTMQISRTINNNKQQQVSIEKATLTSSNSSQTQATNRPQQQFHNAKQAPKQFHLRLGRVSIFSRTIGVPNSYYQSLFSFNHQR